jgi:hypothetical protein
VRVTDEVADWSGDRVVNEIAARVDRAGPRPVSEDHKSGLVHPDVDWLINYLASISKKGSPGDVIIRHVLEIKLSGERASQSRAWPPLALSAAPKSASSPVG